MKNAGASSYSGFIRRKNLWSIRRKNLWNTDFSAILFFLLMLIWQPLLHKNYEKHANLAILLLLCIRRKNLWKICESQIFFLCNIFFFLSYMSVHVDGCFYARMRWFNFTENWIFPGHWPPIPLQILLFFNLFDTK